jgi:hypothetical protein
MKKLIRILIICSFLISINGFSALAAPNDPPPIYIPFLMKSGGTTTTFTVTGTITDVDGFALAYAVVEDVHGASAVTDANGRYTLTVQAGQNTLTATRSGYTFAPSEVSLNILASLSNVNFLAQVGCGNIVVNPTVTTGAGGWDFASDKPGVIAGTDATIFNSPPSSGRTGIDPAAAINILSTTTARSQVYHIPSDPTWGADSVFLGVYLYQVTTSVPGTGDHQYLDLLDKHNNLLENLWFGNLNTAAWTYYEFNLDEYIGQDVKIQVRTVNDGTGGVSAMYFDDVNLTICNTHCSEQVLNGNFELATDWFMFATTVVPPVYTTAFNHTFAGLQSMQTGIPLGGVNVVDSFSEVFQTVDLPSSHDSALLNFWLYNTSVTPVITVTNGTSVTALPQLTKVPAIQSGARPSVVDEANTPDEDTFYVYIMDTFYEPLEAPLVWKVATNTNEWQRYQFDVSEYLGEDIVILFGMFNDGIGEVSAMYVDDVSLGTCP